MSLPRLFPSLPHLVTSPHTSPAVIPVFPLLSVRFLALRSLPRSPATAAASGCLKEVEPKGNE
ncbi:hypothetical protein COCC4DRAFT_30017 [Bipolaris maydis ATCC 48331]|uniref:Uncharacterized protein n=2 Tax=Cochliobolus heterostrophus TaxID=5016 RepID=M2TVZ0_COCH5|nr:uncharacterized protein COCC4DRAFT_30017 [Bipolaris maydis ATCC 48331]EMD90699.1 hypothetical protein COCHEDRAFT_1022490 [Bipolaris maydis C5]ENI09090.1 hypothetical protein COCC4DRAFT_30017 [Bipolaris maydis ATCC 48331]